MCSSTVTGDMSMAGGMEGSGGVKAALPWLGKSSVSSQASRGSFPRSVFPACLGERGGGSVFYSTPGSVPPRNALN